MSHNAQKIHDTVLCYGFQIHEMEGELIKAPPSYRLQMAAQVRNCKRDLEEVERDVVNNYLDVYDGVTLI